MKQIRKTITKAEIAAMPKVLFPGRIFVIYTESEAEKAVAYLKDQRIVGVDTETRPSFKRGTTHKVALLQISTQDTCFLFRLNRIGMPDSLQEFLMSDTLKIGLSLKDDFNSLRKREDVHPDRGNWIELQDYVGRFGIADRSLQKIFANLFGQKISKSQASFQLGGGGAQRGTETICSHGCVGLCGNLQLPDGIGTYGRL